MATPAGRMTKQLVTEDFARMEITIEVGHAEMLLTLLWEACATAVTQETTAN